MKSSIIDLYFNKKKKTLFQYITLISSMINMDNKRLWSKKRDSHNLIRRILDVYIKKYIYSATVDEEYIKKYINYNTKVNDIVNLVVTSIIDIYIIDKKEDLLKNDRDEILLLAIIISSAIELDKETNSLIKQNIDIHYIRKKINEIIVDKSKFILFKNSKKNIRKLANIIKENNKIEAQMFKEIDSININNYFISYSDKQNYYLVKYKYKIDKINDYNKYDVETVIEKENINFKLDILSYNKLAFTILKSIMLKKDNYYVIEFNKGMINISTFNRIDKIFNNNCIKNRVLFLIDDELVENIKQTIQNKGYKVLIDYNDVSSVNPKAFDSNTKVLVKEEFIKNNADNIEMFSNNNVDFQIKRQFDVFEEDMIVKEME